MYLLVDNYDSFTYNLYTLFCNLGVKVKVIKNNEFEDAKNYKGIILSPGPSSPKNSGTTLDYIEKYKGKIPIFGVCLGMQAIGYQTGIKVVKAKTIKHGKTDVICINKETMLFNGLPEKFKAVRYHSLVLDFNEAKQFGSAVSLSDNQVMSYENEEQMLFGVQFHPESVLSEYGMEICKNFVNFCEDITNKKKKVSVTPILRKIVEGKNLTFSESVDLFNLITEEKLTDAVTGAVLTGLKVKGETADEIAGAVSVLNEKKLPFNVEKVEVVDTCGTGGDGKNCMNVSTAVSIVLAAANLYVVKHGNRAMSGKTGSADILERVGVKLNLSVLDNKNNLLNKNFAFLFAQHYHPVLKSVSKIRRQLKIPTLFNLIGPLLNPANPRYQIIGVGDSNYLERLAEVVKTLNRKCVVLYSSKDGYDEVSTEAITECLEVKNKQITEFTINPSDFFKPFPMPVVKSEEDAELMFLRALSNGDPKLTNLLAINAALAFKVAGKVETIKQGFELAKNIIVSQKAYEKLKSLTEV
jgi:anthranilate phosphoribosyltransferase